MQANRAREAIVASFGSVRDVFANPQLRRLEIGWGINTFVDVAALVALSLFAYERAGAAGVGLVGVVRMIPTAIAAPVVASFGDRFRPERVIVAIHASRACSLGALAAVMASDGPLLPFYAVVVVFAIASGASRPVQLAAAPRLARGPEELTAANAAYAMVEGAGTLLGPLFAGLVAAAADTSMATLALAELSLVGAIVTARIDSGARMHAPSTTPGGRKLAEGFAVVTRNRDPRLLAGLFATQTAVRGLLNVLAVVAALELLAMGEQGVGVLTGALGAGSFVATVGTFVLAGRQRLATTFGLALAIWGAPIAVIGLFPHPVVAVAMLTTIGVANAFLDVSGLTLLQRLSPPHVLARMFGAVELIWKGAVGIGSALGAVIVAVAGTRGALIVTGAILPVLALVAWPRLRAIDALVVVRQREIEVLRGIEMFRALPAALLEQLASSVETREVDAGEAVIREGEEGDRFYIVESGRLDVSVAGAFVRTLDAGDHFGEIALLRNIPRTATVVASTPASLRALDRATFLSVMTASPPSHAAADAVAGERLRAAAPDDG